MNTIHIPTIKEWLAGPQFKPQADEYYDYDNDPRIVYRLKDNMGFVEGQLFEMNGKTYMINRFDADLIHFQYHEYDPVRNPKNYSMRINDYQGSWGHETWFDETHGEYFDTRVGAAGSFQGKLIYDDELPF